MAVRGQINLGFKTKIQLGLGLNKLGLRVRVQIQDGDLGFDPLRGLGLGTPIVLVYA